MMLGSGHGRGGATLVAMIDWSCRSKSPSTPSAHTCTCCTLRKTAGVGHTCGCELEHGITCERSIIKIGYNTQTARCTREKGVQQQKRTNPPVRNAHWFVNAVNGK